jgi:hypothetical protein
VNLALESFTWENTTCAADAVALNLPYAPEVRLPVRDVKHLACWKCRCRQRCTPPRRDADCGSQWRILRLRAYAPPSIYQWVDIWGVDDLLTRKFTESGVFTFGVSGPPYLGGRTRKSTQAERGGLAMQSVEHGTQLLRV